MVDRRNPFRMFAERQDPDIPEFVVQRIPGERSLLNSGQRNTMDAAAQQHLYVAQAPSQTR
eukprot:12891362-Alexandrium_andersonii.AAC.1